MAAEGSVC